MALFAGGLDTVRPPRERRRRRSERYSRAGCRQRYGRFMSSVMICRRTYPLAYLRAGRARFFRWLISEGREQHESLRRVNLVVSDRVR